MSGDSLEIVCVAEELEADHLPQLKRVIAEVNKRYRDHVAERARLRAIATEAEQQEKAKLAALKDRLALIIGHGCVRLGRMPAAYHPALGTVLLGFQR